MKKRLTILVFAVLVLLAGAIFWLQNTRHDKQTGTISQTPTPIASTHSGAASDPISFDKTKYSLTNPASLWVVANKHRPLNPKTYVPADLVVPKVTLRSNITGDEKQVRKATAAALEKMFTAARGDSITLNLQSGYRSYDFQVNLYNGYVRQQGQAVADSQSARPGYSEHQTGLAADVGGVNSPGCNVAACFADTPEGKWVAAHAYEYGFLIRYPADKTAVTGYTYEPWHLRYVGSNLALELHNTHTETLEEFFGLGGAPDYQ